jgi:hypothetical protein
MRRLGLILLLLALNVTIPLPASTITETILSGSINLEGWRAFGHLPEFTLITSRGFVSGRTAVLTRAAEQAIDLPAPMEVDPSLRFIAANPNIGPTLLTVVVDGRAINLTDFGQYGDQVSGTFEAPPIQIPAEPGPISFQVPFSGEFIAHDSHYPVCCSQDFYRFVGSGRATLNFQRSVIEHFDHNEVVFEFVSAVYEF